jgi:hypothetical protein
MTKRLKLMASMLLIVAFASSVASCDDDTREPVPIEATGVTLNVQSLTLAVGQIETLTATVMPGNAANKILTWTSSLPAIATVNAGVITAVAVGSTTVTVATANGKSATCIVTVVVPAESVNVEPATLELLVEAKHTLAATVLPDNANNQTLTWTSSAPEIATVVDGEVTAVAVGSATVTVATDNGKSATCEVRVAHIKLTLLQYESATVTVNYISGNSENRTKWTDGAFYIGAISETIRSITLDGGSSVLIGRKTDVDLTFKVNGNKTGFVFRDALEGKVPIGSYAEFKLIGTATALNGNYRQEADLDLLSEEWTPIGQEYSAFTGAFDGDGYTLANLKINKPDKKEVGLFGAVGAAGQLISISLVSGSVSGDERVGGLCGMNAGSIVKCSNAASVSSSHDAGGICGWGTGTTQSQRGIINACYNTGVISGTGYVAGICGYQGTITACYNKGSISGDRYVGGICGNSFERLVTACYNKGVVSGNQQVGGICGLGSVIHESYNTGSVWGEQHVGGICGHGISGLPTQCYWYDDPDDDATSGIGNNTGYIILKFGLFQWPSWGIGDGSGDGKYWKSMGGWNTNGNHVYPSLWFE